jgi:hypothetical protein
MGSLSLEPSVAVGDYPVTSDDICDFSELELNLQGSHGCYPGDMVDSLPAGLTSVAETTRNPSGQGTHQSPVIRLDGCAPEYYQPRSLVGVLSAASSIKFIVNAYID